MSTHLDFQRNYRRGLRRGDAPWLAVAVLATVLGVVALGAFVFGLGGAVMQTAATTPAPITDTTSRSQ
jgi:hypothetical protein